MRRTKPLLERAERHVRREVGNDYWVSRPAVIAAWVAGYAAARRDRNRRSQK